MVDFARLLYFKTEPCLLYTIQDAYTKFKYLEDDGVRSVAFSISLSAERPVALRVPILQGFALWSQSLFC